jgi:hypothetical protein
VYFNPLDGSKRAAEHKADGFYDGLSVYFGLFRRLVDAFNRREILRFLE